MTTSPFRRNVELSGAAVRRRMRERFTEPSSLRSAFSSAKPGELATHLESDDVGRAETGMRLLSNRFVFADQEVKAGPKAIWRAKAPSPAWSAALHSFDWLADLEAVGGQQAKEFSATAALAWLETHQSYDAQVWNHGVAAKRLRAWLQHAALLMPSEGADKSIRVEEIQRGAWAQADWLMRQLGDMEAGVERLFSAISVAMASLAIAGWAPRRKAASKALESAIEGAVLPDGGVVSRSPEDVFTLFVQLQRLQRDYDDASEAPPHLLADAIESLASATRFFRMPDGGLALFHGGCALDDGRVDAELTRARVKRETPVALPQTGFQRLIGGRVAVLMDVGKAPEGAAAETCHGSTLAIEMSSGRRRLVVNCGSAAHMDAEWRRGCRGPSAHSTLVLDDTPFSRPVLTRGAFTGDEDRALVGPPEVLSERKEERNGVWALGAHDGYLESHGVTVTRRLFLSADGGDFRGEDRLVVEDEGERRFDRQIAKLPRNKRDRGIPFVARFHLHPDISAAIVADGEAVTLRLPHGEVWVMRQAGGTLALESSIYIDHAGAPRQTKQILVSGGLSDREAHVRWAFRRVGEVSQLPKDVEALLKQIEAPGPKADTSFDQVEFED